MSITGTMMAKLTIIFSEKLSQQIHKVADDISTIVNLFGLPYVAGAAFNSHVDADDLDTTCMEQTRVDVLEAIRLWFNSRQSKCIFWLNGMAGAGKSTISRTVATELQEKEFLGASFFFKRGERDRGGSSRFFPIIAWQLYQALPNLRSHIKQAVDADLHIADKSLADQFEHLIYRPLRAIAKNWQKPLVMVIDALNECEPEAHVILLIDLLTRLGRIQDLHIRIFLTSRPELAPRKSFRNLTTIKYQDIILHDIAPEVIEHDIVLYLRTRLERIRAQYDEDLPPNWPGEKRIASLTAISTPLFIFAATICRFLGDSYQNPDLRLVSLAQNHDPEAYDKIHRMYEPIVKRLLSETTKRERDSLFQDFQVIVGTIVTLAEPLSIIDLAALLKIDKNHIAMRLRGLHSVLRIPTDETVPVRTLHKSFREFLLDRDRHKKHKFWIDEEATHRMLATKFLDILTEDSILKEDIFDVQDPGARYTSIEQTDRQLPSYLQYACRYWVYHFYRGQSYTHNDMTRIHELLRDRYIYLFEALALCGCASEIIDMMDTLQELALERKNMGFAEFFGDAKRFAMTNVRMVQETPLQLYPSALIFAPQESMIRLSFLHLKPSWISSLPKVPPTWTPLLHTLSNDSKLILSIAFSRNGRQVHLYSSNGTATLWDSACGLLQQSFKFSATGADGLWSVAASQLSNTINLLRGSWGSRYIEVRSLPQATLLHTLPSVEPFYDNPICIPFDGSLLHTLSSVEPFYDNSICLSFDGSLLCCKGNPFRLWNISSGTLQQEIEFHSHVEAVAFSSDDKLLSYLLLDGTLGVLDVNLGVSQWQFKNIHHRGSTKHAKVAMIGSQFLVYGAFCDSVKLWSLTAHEMWHEYTSIRDCRAIAATKDGKVLAVGELDRIYLCDPMSRTILNVLTNHAENMASLTFSPQDKYLAVNTGRFVSLWDVTQATRAAQASNEDDLHYSQLVLSANGRWLLSISDTRVARLWSVISGNLKLCQELGREPVEKAAFSTCNRFVVTASMDALIKIWHILPSGNMLLKQDMALKYDTGDIQCLGLSSDDHILAIAIDESFVPRREVVADACVQIWDLRPSPPQRRCILDCGLGTPFSIAFSSENDILAVARFYGDITLFRLHPTDYTQVQSLLTIPTDTATHIFSVHPWASMIETDLGWLEFEQISRDLLRSPSEEFSMDKFSLRWPWITKNDRNVLLLPVEYKTEVFSFQNGLFAFHPKTGGIRLIELSSDGLP